MRFVIFFCVCVCFFSVFYCFYVAFLVFLSLFSPFFDVFCRFFAAICCFSSDFLLPFVVFCRFSCCPLLFFCHFLFAVFRCFVLLPYPTVLWCLYCILSPSRALPYGEREFSDLKRFMWLGFVRMEGKLNPPHGPVARHVGLFEFVVRSTHGVGEVFFPRFTS